MTAGPQDTPLPPGMRVRGGRGGTQARLADLERAAGALVEVAAALSDVADAAVVLAAVVDQAAVWSPSTATPARLGATTVLAGGRRNAANARQVADGLLRAAQTYAAADRMVLDGVRRGIVLGGRALGEAGPTVWAATALAGLAAGLGSVRLLVAVRSWQYLPGPLGLLGGAVSRGGAALSRRPGPVGGLGMLVGGPGLLPSDVRLPPAAAIELAVPGVAGFLTGALPGRALPVRDPVPGAAGILAGASGLATALLRTPPSGLVVTPTGGPEPTPTPRTLADVLEQVDRRYPASGAEPGTVAILRIDHPDGSRGWVVAVPGTQVGSVLAGTNPMDMTTNFALVAGRPADASSLVARSMEQAGIAPGEPVLLAGHSQGGMVAMDVAGDPVLGRRFEMTAVLTAGSPVGGMDLGPSTQALHVEHRQDLLPGVEGVANPATPQRTTVVRDLAVSPLAVDQDAARSVAGAHELSTYLRTVRTAQGGDDPSIRGFEAAVGRVLGPAGSVATSTVYQGVRVVG